MLPSSKRLVLVIVASLCSALIIAGCGGGTKGASKLPLSSDTPIPVPVFAPGTTMARIQQAGKLNVGTSFSQGAFSSRDASGNLTGFDIDLAQYIAQALFGGTRAAAAQRINYVQAEANNRETFLQNGTIDVALGAYQITAARQAQVSFAGPDYETHGQAMVMSTDKRTQAISDLNGRNVCVPSNTDLATPLISAAPQVNVVTQPTLAQCESQLQSGAVDALVDYDWTLAPVGQADSTVRLLNSFFNPADYGIGIKSGDGAFRQFLNSTLQDFEDDKQWAAAFAATLGKTGLGQPQPPRIDTSPTSPNAGVAVTTSTSSAVPSTTSSTARKGVTTTSSTTSTSTTSTSISESAD
jgi:glutamate transport system substrate-binding protein